MILLLAFGVVPVGYAIYFAFTNANNYFAGFSNFVQSASDFRYLPAFEHIGVYLVIWLVALVILVTGLALVLHQLPARRLGRAGAFPLLHSGGAGGGRERPGVAVHARPDRQPGLVVPAPARL